MNSNEAMILAVMNAIFTGLPYGNPSRKMGRFLRFVIFRVGKSLACYSPAK